MIFKISAAGGEKDRVIEDEFKLNSNHTCRFGNYKLNVGDSLVKTKKSVTCKCVLPPIAHCVQMPRQIRNRRQIV